MTGRLFIFLTVTVGKECSKRSVQDVGELSSRRSVHNPGNKVARLCPTRTIKLPPHMMYLHCALLAYG